MIKFPYKYESKTYIKKKQINKREKIIIRVEKDDSSNHIDVGGVGCEWPDANNDGKLPNWRVRQLQINGLRIWIFSCETTHKWII